MAAGLLHEIKQPLSGIYGLIELMQLEKNLPPKSKKQLDTVQEALNRMDQMMDRFGSISAIASEQITPISLPEMVDKIRDLFGHHLMRHRIELTVDVQEGVPAIKASTDGIQQIISNLMINAMHALETRDESDRRIDIKIAPHNGSVRLDFADNGCGMSAHVQEHLFDPFFTTKGPEKGSGLGLAIVESILHHHQANIRLESEIGKGTRFSIEFPVAGIEETS
jgi:signal transduction histidine kinase